MATHDICHLEKVLITEIFKTTQDVIDLPGMTQLPSNPFTLWIKCGIWRD